MNGCKVENPNVQFSLPFLNTRVLLVRQGECEWVLVVVQLRELSLWKTKGLWNAIIKCRVCSSLLNWLVNRILLRFVKLLLVGWLERERWSWKIPFISLTVILYLISILIYSLTRTEREYVSSRLPVASLTDFTIHLSSFISTSAVKFYALFSLQGFLMVVKTACSIVPIGNVVKMENDLCNGVCSLFENVAIFDCVRNLKSKSKSS